MSSNHFWSRILSDCRKKSKQQLFCRSVRDHLGPLFHVVGNYCQHFMTNLVWQVSLRVPFLSQWQRREEKANEETDAGIVALVWMTIRDQQIVIFHSKERIRALKSWTKCRLLDAFGYGFQQKKARAFFSFSFLPHSWKTKLLLCLTTKLMVFSEKAP